MLVFWNILYSNVLLEYMFVNKLNWAVPHIEVERGCKYKNEEKENSNNNFEKGRGNIRGNSLSDTKESRNNIEKNIESSDNINTDTSYQGIENERIPPPHSPLSLPLSLPLSRLQPEKILLPLGGNFFIFFVFFFFFSILYFCYFAIFQTKFFCFSLT